MNSFRKLLAALALTCALSAYAFAGDIGTQGITSTGETGTPVTTTAETGTGDPSSTDSITGIALSLLQSAISLF